MCVLTTMVLSRIALEQLPAVHMDICFVCVGLLQDNQPTAAPMCDEECGELLRHLKIKWASVNVEYQKLGFVMDIGKQCCCCCC